MTRVIARCPNCGVEHDDAQIGACEVCGTTLRNWCRVHSREIGWLDSAECPRCAAESAAPRARPTPPRATTPAPPRPPAEVPPRTTSRPRRRPPPVIVDTAPPEWADAPPPMGRDPRDVFREGVEELGPYVTTGATVAVRLFAAVLAVIRNLIGWGLLGAIAGGGFGYYQGGDVLWSALAGAMVGGGIGLFFGIITAFRVLFAPPPPRER